MTEHGREVLACGYVGVTAPDLSAWRAFATEGLGLQVAGDASGGEDALLLRMDERAWRIAVLPGPGGLAFCGWEVRDAPALERLAERLAMKDGPPYEHGRLALCCRLRDRNFPRKSGRYLPGRE